MLSLSLLLLRSFNKTYSQQSSGKVSKSLVAIFLRLLDNKFTDAILSCFSDLKSTLTLGGNEVCHMLPRFDVCGYIYGTALNRVKKMLEPNNKYLKTTLKKVRVCRQQNVH
jgi:hypothetical protein